jgi:hypothetical protein
MPKTAIVLGHVQAAQAQFGNFAPGRAIKAARLFGCAAAVEGIALVHPFAHSVAELYLVVRKIEVHVYIQSVGDRACRLAADCPASFRF